MSLTVNYKGAQIAELTQDGNLTLNTAGKYCEGDISLDYSGGGAPTPPEPPETPTDAVIFYSPNAFTLRVENRTKNWDGTLYYSIDNSIWATWNGSDVLNAEQSNGYYQLYLRGLNNTKITGNSSDHAWKIVGAGIECKGNLNNLLNYTETPTLADFAFAFLFYYDGNIDFDVTLPATTLANSCYEYMFNGCSSLTTAPALPATTLADSCYSSMFSGCISLTTVPELPATTLADYCYYYMFSGCSSLTTVPALPATTLARRCYYYMFSGCISLTTVPELPATTLADYCYYYMFNGCLSLTTAPALPATTLASNCYNSMFNGCVSLTTAPALPATTLVTDCYHCMFQGCLSLTTTPALPATTLRNSCYYFMFNNCSQIKLSTTQTGEYQTEYRIPTSGTGTTASNALNNMFTGTGGTFTGTPTINTIYYTSNTVIPAN